METRIIIPNNGGKLVGILHKKSAETLFIVCHGYGGSKDDAALTGISRGLAKRGLSAFRFDFSGTGESSGRAGVIIEKQTDDLLNVINCFRSYPEIVLVGGSLGALPVILASLTTTRISAIITFNGFFGKRPPSGQYRKIYFWIRLLTVINPHLRRAYRKFTDEFRPEKIAVPVLVICSKSDATVDYRQSVDFYNKLTTKNKKLAVLPLASHGLSQKGDTGKVVTEICAWNFIRAGKPDRRL
jgi:alpha-beta hydrolase superfamily lysophospholipase